MSEGVRSLQNIRALRNFPSESHTFTPSILKKSEQITPDTMTTVIAYPPAFALHNEQVDIADLEVDDILNEIGIFADENLFLDNQGYVSNKFPPMTASTGFVPVSPDRIYASPATTEETQYTVSSVMLASSLPVVTYQTFSVPNPISAPIAPTEVEKQVLKVEPVVSQADASAKQADQQPSSVPEKAAEQMNHKRKISSVSDMETKELKGGQMLERR
jgi:hypothetical protein